MSAKSSSQLHTQLSDLQELLDAADVREPHGVPQTSDAKRLIEALLHAPDRLSAVNLIVRDPAGARALGVELQLFSEALERVIDLRPRIAEDAGVSPYWIALSALLRWTALAPDERR